MTRPPRRRYCLVATVQGDEPADLRSMLVELVEWVGLRGTPPAGGHVTQAGGSRSMNVQLEVRPEITPESYARELRKYLEETKLPSFEPKPLGFCGVCERAVFSDLAAHDGKRLLCADCAKEKPRART